MDFKEIEQILSKEPRFRLKQVKQSLFCDLINNWPEAITLPLALRQKLGKEFPITIKAEEFKSKDSRTIKALINLEDDLKIESVLMQHNKSAAGSSLSATYSNPALRTPAFVQNPPRLTKDRNTVCVSSQVGCPLACGFCATGRIGFERNLTSWEIIEQVLFFARYLKKEGQKISNIVFMGMGEPFLNYDNVIGAIRILHDKDGFNLGARHFSVSTCGITEGIEKLADEKLEINLAISLHAPNDELRSKLMPVNKKYSISQILKAVDEYIKITRRRVMFEYIMIKDVNDSDSCAKELVKIINRPLYFVNLISYNNFGNLTADFKPSTNGRIKKFKEILEKAGVPITQRYRFGQDIKAACGQLAYKSK